MARIDSILQPFGTPAIRHVDIIRRTLSNSAFNNFKISPAFVTASGVLELAGELSRCGASLQCVAGINNGVTTAQGLLSLFANGVQLYVADTRSPQSIFHQKIYCGFGDTNGEVIIGSTNLTFRALNNNIEASARIGIDRNEPEDQLFLDDIVHFFDDITTNYAGFVDRIERPRQILNLLNDHRVEDERISQPVSSPPSGSSTGASAPGISLPFNTPSRHTGRRGSRSAQGTSTPAARPAAAQPQPAQPQPAQKASNRRIWFETGSMTSAARNQLDLSKIGKSDKTRGSVSLFGINGNSVNTQKDITIRYKGGDYAGNRILYPDNAHANGTWRLQMMGRRANGDRFTEHTRNQQLCNKLLVFEEIGPDHFELDVLDKSQTSHFEGQSNFSDQTQSTANPRKYGEIV